MENRNKKNKKIIVPFLSPTRDDVKFTEKGFYPKYLRKIILNKRKYFSIRSISKSQRRVQEFLLSLERKLFGHNINRSFQFEVLRTKGFNNYKIELEGSSHDLVVSSEHVMFSIKLSYCFKSDKNTIMYFIRGGATWQEFLFTFIRFMFILHSPINLIVGKHSSMKDIIYRSLAAFGLNKEQIFNIFNISDLDLFYSICYMLEDMLALREILRNWKGFLLFLEPLRSRERYNKILLYFKLNKNFFTYNKIEFKSNFLSFFRKMLPFFFLTNPKRTIKRLFRENDYPDFFYEILLAFSRSFTNLCKNNDVKTLFFEAFNIYLLVIQRRLIEYKGDPEPFSIEWDIKKDREIKNMAKSLDKLFSMHNLLKSPYVIETGSESEDIQSFSEKNNDFFQEPPKIDSIDEFSDEKKKRESESNETVCKTQLDFSVDVLSSSILGEIVEFEADLSSLVEDNEEFYDDYDDYYDETQFIETKFDLGWEKELHLSNRDRKNMDKRSVLPAFPSSFKVSSEIIRIDKKRLKLFENLESLFSSTLIDEIYRIFMRFNRSNKTQRGGRRGRIISRDLSLYPASNYSYKNIFKKNRRNKGLVLHLLVDLSGSMGAEIPVDRGLVSFISRYELAFFTVRMLAKALDRTDIRYMISGFSAHAHYSRFGEFIFKDFAEPFNEEVLLVDGPWVSFWTENRDGDSIRFAFRHFRTLLKDDMIYEKPVLIVISDGVPHQSCTGYKGVSGIRDTKAAVEELRRQGVFVYAFVINNYIKASNFETMYKEGFFELLKDPLELPSKIVSLLKRIMREIERG